MNTTGKKILFINPPMKAGFRTDRIHMGLTLLGQILVNAGCEVKVLDYAFLGGSKGATKPPSVFDIVSDFRPDVIGLTVFTYLYEETLEIIQQVARCSDAPIILGGPHITLFTEDFTTDSRISYLVRGEAESIILDVVTNAEKQNTPIAVDAVPPTPECIPQINLEIVYGSEDITNYQIQLSRGCPFSCSFCNVELIAGSRRVRARGIEVCLDQIAQAVHNYPTIKNISITDDCPNYDKKRFKRFLAMFAERGFDCNLQIDNVRADLIDEEMIQLYVKAGGQNICLGTESAHPEVFGMIHKGESLEQIFEACRLVRKYRLKLGLCFVIGLPGDSLEKHMYSVELAKKLKPDYIFWNMCTPWPGTEVYEWFEKHGEQCDVRGFSTLIDSSANFSPPRAWTPSFTRDERIKAWFIANFETFQFPIDPPGQFVKNIPKLFRIAQEYKILTSYLRYLAGVIPHHFKIAIEKQWRLFLQSK